MKKIVAIIFATTAILMFAPTAYASDGDLDSSWGGDGVVISAHTDPSSAYAVANYPDNRVLVVGSVTDSPSSRILINRFLADGSPDTTCNNTGQFVDTVNDAVASDVVVLSDGSFVVAGTIQINNVGTLFVAKFTSTCEIDGSFGNSGFATYSAGQSTAGTALAVQSNGLIIVAGYENVTLSDGGVQRILVARLTTSGTLDHSFGANGRFTSSISQDGRAQDVIIDSDGRIIFAGSVIGPSRVDAAIVGRLTRNGQVDSTFANQGYLIDEFGGEAQLNAIAMRPNGNLVSVGNYILPYPNDIQSPIVVCLLQTGATDTECGIQGWTYLPIANSGVSGDDVFVTPDNRILLSGASDDGTIRPIVMRLNDNATLDNSFATSGTWRGSALTGQMYSMTIQSNGRILAAGGLDAQGTMSVGVVRLANTVVTPSTTTTTTTTTTTFTSIAPLVTTTSTTIAADQLPATGRDENGLMFAVAVFGLGILLMGMRRRALR